MAKETFKKNATLFTNKFYINLRKNERNATFGAQLSMLQKLGHFGKHIRITLKEFKRGAGEG